MAPGRKYQRKKVVPAPQRDPMAESSITTLQTGHTEPDPQPDPQPETEPQIAEPILPQEQTPAMPSTSPD